MTYKEFYFKVREMAMSAPNPDTNLVEFKKWVVSLETLVLETAITEESL